MEAREVSWRGRTIRSWTTGSGPAVVLCHGTPWSSAVWWPVAERLAERYTVHLWDMPGYGASSKEPIHEVDLATQGELLAWLLDEWGLEAPHVVAHDIGGAVALRAHLLHGRELASLALVDTVAQRPWGSPLYLLIQEHADVFARLPANMHLALLREYVSGAASSDLSEGVLEALLEPWLDDMGQAAFYRQVEQVRHAHTDEIEPLLADLRCRTRVFWGGDDTWLPVGQGRALADLLPGAELVTYPEAGHLLPLERPDRLAEDLARWL